MVAPEPNGHIKGRLDHPNPEEAEEINFKCKFMKMMETFKEEMKNSLKEMEEKTKIGKKKFKSLKETQEKNR